MNSEVLDTSKDNKIIPNEINQSLTNETEKKLTETKEISNEANEVNESLGKDDECKLCLMGLNKWVNKNDIIKFLESKEITYKYSI